MISRKRINLITSFLTNTAFFVFAILFVLFGMYKFIEKQDERYDKYSRNAIRACKEDSYRKLMWDEQLQYWKCQ